MYIFGSAIILAYDFFGLCFSLSGESRISITSTGADDVPPT